MPGLLYPVENKKPAMQAGVDLLRHAPIAGTLPPERVHGVTTGQGDNDNRPHTSRQNRNLSAVTNQA
ncbi:hypothetical protein OKW43_005678 [Paraburkholderia sp. WC7.3g]